MKVMILNPPYGEDFCRSARWAAKSRGRVQRHPDWLLTAAAVLEKARHAVEFIDGAALNLSRDEIQARIAKFGPGLFVCHTSTPSIYSDLSYARLAKEISGSKTVLVGPHASVLAGETFDAAGGCVDYIARGEYDLTLRDIADGKAPAGIEGLSFMEGGELVNNPDRPPLDVNELPFPAWRQIKPEWYRDAGKRFPFLTLLSGRGCFGRCTFCRDVPVMYGRGLRLRSPAAVADEIEYDYKLFPQLKEIMFETDTFTASPDHVRGVCGEMLRRNLKITWSCNVRVDMDQELLPLMKRAGCRMLMVGFEFGSQGSLDAVKKGITLEQSRRFAGKARSLGFTLHGCFMIGAPDETRESARETIEFAKSLPLDTAQFSGVCVYPGTEMYEWSKKNGYLVPKGWEEWVDGDNEQVTLLNYPQLSKGEMDALIDTGLREFYLRPGQVLKMAFRIGSFDDIVRKFYGLKSLLGYAFGTKKAVRKSIQPEQRIK